MSDLSPGQVVTVSPSGITAEVLYVRGETVRVRNVNSGKARTVAIKNVTPKRESKVLTVGPVPMNSIADMLAPMQRVYDSSFRPVPKPVTLTSPAYLAYVRKHPCCFCGATEGVVPSHWGHHGASMSKKVDDYRTIPLCDPCHMGEWHRTGTFSGMDRVASEAFTLRVQRELLLAWTATRISDGDMVDALIRAIGGADA